jgi:hypothetical protein
MVCKLNCREFEVMGPLVERCYALSRQYNIWTLPICRRFWFWCALRNKSWKFGKRAKLSSICFRHWKCNLKSYKLAWIIWYWWNWSLKICIRTVWYKLVLMENWCFRENSKIGSWTIKIFLSHLWYFRSTSGYLCW